MNDRYLASELEGQVVNDHEGLKAGIQVEYLNRTCPLFLTTKVLFGHPYFNSGSMFLHGEKKKQAETL